MKEIKVFMHKNRIADVVHALKVAKLLAPPNHLSITNVYGSLKAVDNKEKNYSIEFGEGIISEVKLELICEDKDLEQAIDIIRKNSQTGQAISACIYINDIGRAEPIKNTTKSI